MKRRGRRKKNSTKNKLAAKKSRLFVRSDSFEKFGNSEKSERHRMAEWIRQRWNVMDLGSKF